MEPTVLISAVLSGTSLAFFLYSLITWLFAPLSKADSPIEQEWARLRRQHSKLFRYADVEIERLGGFLSQYFFGKRTIYEVWVVEGQVVPMSPALMIGYQFTRLFIRCFLGIALVGLLLGSINIWSWLLLTTAMAGLLTMKRLRKMQAGFTERLNQLRADLSFAIDVIALYDSEAIQLPVHKALEAVAEEFSETEIGKELRIVIQQLQLGCLLEEAMTSFAKRWGNDLHVQRFSELVIAKDNGNTSESSLRKLSQEISNERRQTLVAKSEKSQRKLSFSNILFTYACILMLVSPFLMKIPEILSVLG